MPERNFALATLHPYHRPCKIEGNSLRRKFTAVAGLQYLRTQALSAGHDDYLHRTSPPPRMRRTLRRYMSPATMESPKPA
jgi:hypothetical protein